jgi:hypothetical protein
MADPRPDSAPARPDPAPGTEKIQRVSGPLEGITVLSL